MHETLQSHEVQSFPFRGQAIMLAGGLGTRLRSEVADLPKCMAPVAGKPFLHYIIAYCQQRGITKFIFALGYMHEVIKKYLGENYPSLDYQISIEEEPLGTGGGIQLACAKATEKNVAILNGDTLFEADINALLNLHFVKDADCTLSLKPMHDFERYGVVELNEDATISSFKEKQFYKSGLINGGVYALNVERFLSKKLPKKNSFEKNYLEEFYKDGNMFGLVQDGYFIDIGIPEDYKKANKDLAK